MNKKELIKVARNNYKDCYIKGKSLKYCQIVQNGNFTSTDTWTAMYGTATAEDNVLTYTNTTSHTAARIQTSQISFVAGHKYLFSMDFKGSATQKIQARTSADIIMSLVTLWDDAWRTYIRTFTTSSASNILYLYNNTEQALTTEYTCQYRNVMIFDLTEMYGAGNEPTILPNIFSSYLAYPSGIINSTGPLTFNGGNLFSISSDKTGMQHINIFGNEKQLIFYSDAAYGRVGVKVDGLTVGKSYTISCTVTKKGDTSSNIQVNSTTSWSGDIGYIFSRASEVSDVDCSFTFTATQTYVYIGFYVTAGSTLKNECLIVNNFLFKETDTQSYSINCARTSRLNLGQLPTGCVYQISLITDGKVNAYMTSHRPAGAYYTKIFNGVCSKYTPATNKAFDDCSADNIISSRDDNKWLSICIRDTNMSSFTTVQEVYNYLNGTYLEYEPMDVLVLKSANNVADELYNLNGRVIRKIATIDLGELSWTMPVAGFFTATISGIKKPTHDDVVINALCDKYQIGSYNTMLTTDLTLSAAAVAATSYSIEVHDSTYSDVTSFQTAMSGRILNYELNTYENEDCATIWLPTNITQCISGNNIELEIQDN